MYETYNIMYESIVFQHSCMFENKIAIMKA